MKTKEIEAAGSAWWDSFLSIYGTDPSPNAAWERGARWALEQVRKWDRAKYKQHEGQGGELEALTALICNELAEFCTIED